MSNLIHNLTNSPNLVERIKGIDRDIDTLNTKVGNIPEGMDIGQSIIDLQDNKQDKLTAGEGISINNNVISNTQKNAEWGNITGDITDQTDLQNELNSISEGIPTNTSDLINNSGFITNSVNDLVNYYLKSETYTQAEVDNLIGSTQNFHYEIYPNIGSITTPLSNVLYLIGPSGTGSDRYEEYVYSNNNFVKIGETSIDLSGYVTIDNLNNALSNYTTTANLTTLLAQKQDVLTAGSGININSNNEISADTSVLATKTDLNSKQDTLTAGTGINIDANNVISATATPGQAYTAGNGIDIDSNNEISVDTSVVATQTDLNTKQDILIAGDNIQIASDGKTVSAIDTKYTAGTGINIDANNVISSTSTGVQWGNITGTLSDQTDLQNVLDAKANKTDVLAKDNTTAFTPTGDYNPATKKYVDDSISANNWIEVNVATAAGTAAKVGTTTAGNYTPTKGDFLLVNFVNGCGVDNPTLNIDGSGAKNIMTGSANANKSTFALGTTANSNIKALLYYDGTYYRCWSTTNTNTTYSAMSVAEGQTGTATSSRAMRADYLKQIIKYHAVSDTAYDSTWDGVTSIAPSKNAVYNKIESLSSSIPSSSATAPSNPTEGQLWYDTTNDQLKVYDGTNWNVVGDDSADINTKTFYLSNTNDLTNAQAAYDWYKAGKNPIIIYDGNTYVLHHSTNLVVFRGYVDASTSGSSSTILKYRILSFAKSGDTITSITYSTTQIQDANFLSTNVDYGTPYTPAYPGSPATKKYVDDNIITYTAGTNISINNNEISAVDTTYTAGNGIAILNGSDYSAMQGPAPDGFHIPLLTEWQGLKTIMDGLSLTTGDGWRINLHMPFAGNRRIDDASLYSQGTSGVYWSAYSSSINGYYLFINSSSVNAIYGNRCALGYSLRCFKDSYMTPDSAWTVVQGTLGSAGIFWNQTEGLISITDGTTGYTIMDKNLGATTVYNNGDTLTQANMGNMYQWGNNYGFPSTGTISNTSPTQVNASAYGPNTENGYYSSDTFIIRNDNWSSVVNEDLWGGVTGVVTFDNAIANTGVLSVNGQTGDVTIDDNTKIFVINEAALTSGGSISNIEPFKDICERLISNPKHIAYITNKRSIMPHELKYIGSVMQIISHSGQFLDENNWMFNFIYIGFPFVENKELFKYCGAIEVNNGTARVANITADKINFAPGNSGTAGQVLTKTASGYNWQNASGGITNDTTGTTSTISQEWVGTKAEFNALSNYGDKIYNIIE